jgi:high-affinity iron transporter
MAATKDIESRHLWVWLGVGIGITIALILACFLNYTSYFFSGVANDILNIVILSLAVIMIAWTLIWMKSYVSEINMVIKNVGMATTTGKAPLYTISVLVATAIVREGAELILLSYGTIVSSKIPFSIFAIGGFIGLSLGALLGYGMYLGLVNIRKKNLFAITTILLTLLAAGMAAQIPNFLTSVGWATSLSNPVWNSSHLLPESSLLGKILHFMVGYTEKPNMMQLIFYFITVLVISLLLYIQKASDKPPQPHIP